MPDQCQPNSNRDRVPDDDRNLPVEGNVISWTTMGGEKHRGQVVEMDGNVAIVQCDDGKRRAVEC